MNQEQHIQTSNDNDRGKINLREVFKKYGYYWKWFVLSILIAVVAAFTYLRFATYEYEVSTTILINDEDNDGGSTSEIAVFEDLGLFEGPKTSLETEMGILKSKTLIEHVIKDLGLNITYYINEGLTKREVFYDEIPIKINLFVEDSLKLYRLDTLFSIKAISPTKYVLSNSENNQKKEGKFGEKTVGNLGEIIATPSNVAKVEVGEEVIIKISPLENVAIDLKKRIQLEPDNLNSNLLILSLQDPVKMKAQMILDNLVSNYNRDANEYKSQIAENTDEFINSRIADISVELTSLDLGVETYKTENKLSDINSEAGIVLASNAEIANEIADLTSQIKLIDYVMSYMKTNEGDLLPSNLGVIDQAASQNTINYNNLILERNRVLKGANTENPVIVSLNDEIARLRESIDRSLVNTKSSLEISLNQARQQEFRLGSKLSATPKKEREIKDIQRQQQIIETLYLYLLQKREENSISLAVKAPNAKVIDRAYGSNVPVAPRRIVILLSSFLIGFLVPAIIISLRNLFDDKIHSLYDIRDVMEAPILGDIPSFKSESIILDYNRSDNNIAESFRLLRTNILHALPPLGITAQTLLVTSTIRGEGRNFIAVNLATAFARLNKKTLLIEADIKKPHLAQDLKIGPALGLVKFMTEGSTKVKDIIINHDRTNLDIICAGSSQSIESEILTNGRFEEILDFAKDKYQYIIVVTPPVNTVADSLLMGQFADLTAYVVRANYLSKLLLEIPRQLFVNKRLPNMALILNDSDYQKNGYDGAYAYGKSGPSLPWWKRSNKTS